MYSTNIIDDVKINNIIKHDNVDIDESNYESFIINQESSAPVKEMYSNNTKIIKSFYKYSLAFLVFTSWVYGLTIVALTKKTEHNVHSLTWIPLLVGSYVNMLLFGFCYFIGDY